MWNFSSHGSRTTGRWCNDRRLANRSARLAAAAATPLPSHGQADCGHCSVVPRRFQRRVDVERVAVTGIRTGRFGDIPPPGLIGDPLAASFSPTLTNPDGIAEPRMARLGETVSAASAPICKNCRDGQAESIPREMCDRMRPLIDPAAIDRQDLVVGEKGVQLSLGISAVLNWHSKKLVRHILSICTL